jgi:hypothetical protein
MESGNFKAASILATGPAKILATLRQFHNSSMRDYADHLM